jgi:hypothetical protein
VSRPEPRWKQNERAVARYWGSERTPLSGSNSRHGTHSDTLHPTVYLEFKHGAGCPATYAKLIELFLDIEDKARAEHKRAVLVLHPKRMPLIDDWPTYVRVGLETSPPFQVLGAGAYGRGTYLACLRQHDAREIVLGKQPEP